MEFVNHSLRLNHFLRGPEYLYIIFGDLLYMHFVLFLFQRVIENGLKNL